MLIPRWVDCRRVTFKYGLGEEFIDVLRMLATTGPRRTTGPRARRRGVAPRDVVAAVLPDPATLGDRMHGAHVRGNVGDAAPASTAGRREVYLYHVADNAETMARHGAQAVVWQTAINPVVALELLATGAWAGAGVLGPEAFDAVPFLEMLATYGAPHGMVELT